MEEKGRSSTGLEENVAGFFCYILGFITGIVFLSFIFSSIPSGF